ncbi:MAG: hypothetical protein KBS83_04615 [Lachnospiraceae bacterium]|nr:hypothetical protein [Candidatus Equihabitans merdae]
MKCMNCGAELTESAYCPECGTDVSVQKQAIVLSGLYYNQGLEKAQIRDLSGAIDHLKRSLKFNKVNIPARNLLGLVYFETGEVVAALSEWVISKNIQPENNIASGYIDILQKDANHLDVINQTIKKYNMSLENCLNGNEDAAEIQLKKILAQNPKLIKGYHLLSLLHIRKGEYESARALLKKAALIDKTNSTTLRFLKEVDEQTGKVTSLDPRVSFWNNREKMDKREIPEVGGMESEDHTLIQPTGLSDRFGGWSILQILMGFLIGAAFIFFLVMPARIEKVNQKANDSIAQFSAQMATQSAEVDQMREKIKDSERTVASAQEQIEAADAMSLAYQKLMLAINALNDGAYTEAATYIAEVDVSQLSEEAKEIYNKIYSRTGTSLVAQYKEAGIAAFNAQDYATAIAQLEAARKIDSTDYDVLNYLGHSYRLSGDTVHADECFQQIINTYPNTTRAENAALYMTSEPDMSAAGNQTPTQDPGMMPEAEQAAPDEVAAPEEIE